MKLFQFKKKEPDTTGIVIGDMKHKAKKANEKEYKESNDMVISSVAKSGSLHIVKKFQRLISTRKRRLLFAVIILTVAILFLGGFLLFSSNKKDPTTKNVLTLSDLENSEVEITPQTSDASVDNLTKEVKTKIDKQIADKQNPIDSVKELAGVLSNTTNQTRQDQLTNFVEDFLANHEKTLWLAYEYNKPDQAQVNFWKAELYAYLVYNFQNMMLNKFTDANGKPIDTTKQQLKYIDLYLALANDPASHPPIPEKDKEFIAGYVYKEADNFLGVKSSISGGRVQR